MTSVINVEGDFDFRWELEDKNVGETHLGLKKGLERWKNRWGGL